MRISQLPYKDKEKRLKISFPISDKESNQLQKLNDFRYAKTRSCLCLLCSKEFYATAQVIFGEPTENKSPFDDMNIGSNAE